MDESKKNTEPSAAKPNILYDGWVIGNKPEQIEYSQYLAVHGSPIIKISPLGISLSVILLISAISIFFYRIWTNLSKFSNPMRKLRIRKPKDFVPQSTEIRHGVEFLIPFKQNDSDILFSNSKYESEDTNPSFVNMDTNPSSAGHDSENFQPQQTDPLFEVIKNEPDHKEKTDPFHDQCKADQKK